MKALSPSSIVQRCLRCGSLLDEKGHTAADENTPPKLESDGINMFYRCPACSAQNVVMIGASPHGLAQLKISHIRSVS